MAGDRFEGYDVKVVEERIGAALERARAGEGPTFIEIETYRFRGHSMSDPGKYRSREELEARKKKDPLVVCRKHLEEAGVKEEDIDAAEEEADEEIAEALRFAEEAEPAKEEVMFGTVYANDSASAQPAGED